ncbi:MAG: hypothetical protein ACC662_09580, partial [Planctomycetota bacterium]
GPRLADAALGAIGLGLTTLLLGRLLGFLAGGETPSGGLWLLPWLVLLGLALFDPGRFRRLRRLLPVEAVKLLSRPLFLTGLGGAVAIALLAALTYELIPGATGWARAVHALGAGQWAAEVFLLVLGATAIAGEASTGTLKMMLPHAYRRSDWILAKACVLLFAALVLTVLVTGVSVAYAAATDGLGPVMQEPLYEGAEAPPDVFATATVMREHLGEAILASLGAAMVTALLGLFLSTLFEGVVGALSVAFLFFAGLRFADVLLGLPTETLQAIYTWHPQELRTITSKLARGFSERWDRAILPAGLALALVTGAAMVLLAVRTFARRDLHN